jgi:hypothetical protein
MTRLRRQESPTSLLVDALATFRLVKLVRDDRITQVIRDGVRSAQGPPDRSKVTYLLDCPWCLSIYFGTALTLSRLRWPRTTALMSRSLALSNLTGLATERLRRS